MKTTLFKTTIALFLVSNLLLSCGSNSDRTPADSDAADRNGISSGTEMNNQEDTAAHRQADTLSTPPGQ